MDGTEDTMRDSMNSNGRLSLLDQLGQDAIGVLTYGQEEYDVDVLAEIERGLKKKDGLEMGVHLINEVGGSTEVVKLKIREVLRDIELDSSAKVDKVIELCQSLEMDSEAMEVAEVSDSLLTSWPILIDCSAMPKIFRTGPLNMVKY
jgi:hypothetical protein